LIDPPTNGRLIEDSPNGQTKDLDLKFFAREKVVFLVNTKIFTF
jgi:hypothetical protein